MRIVTIAGTGVALLLAGCGEKGAGDAVRAHYDNQADAIDAQARRQPTDTAKDIYKARADAIREEGKDRQKGMEGREPSSGPDTGQPAGGATPKE
jgi:hypothetical protein